MSKKKTTTFDIIVIGTLFLNSKSFCILFDLTVTHSITSTWSALQLNLENVNVEANYRITLPNDSTIECPILYKHVPITIGRTIFLRDLIRFDLSNFDIILRINWLHTYGAKIDYKGLKVSLSDEKG